MVSGCTYIEADLIVYVSVPEVFFVRVGVPNTDAEELLQHQSRCTMSQSQNILQLSLSNQKHTTLTCRHTLYDSHNKKGGEVYRSTQTAL